MEIFPAIWDVFSHYFLNAEYTMHLLVIFSVSIVIMVFFDERFTRERFWGRVMGNIIHWVPLFLAIILVVHVVLFKY